jgi:hypothetical protein
MDPLFIAGRATPIFELPSISRFKDSKDSNKETHRMSLKESDGISFPPSSRTRRKRTRKRKGLVSFASALCGLVGFYSSQHDD